jgi:hypothetical protein
VAIYDRALDQTEVWQNLVSGLNLPLGVDPNLRIEIGPVDSYVILENSLIAVRYEPFTAGHDQFAIKQFNIKSQGDQNQVGIGTYQFLEADTGRGTLSSAQLVLDDLARKTIRLEWNQENNPLGKIIHEISIYPYSRFIQVDYIDVLVGINIVDIGIPGGSANGEHYAYGGDSWIRGYVTVEYTPTVGSYYNRYPGDGIFDPTDGGSLNCNGNFVFGVFAQNGVGFGRVMPVADISIVKLLSSDTARRGFEMFPYPFFLPHQPFTGYLFAITDGANDVDSVALQGLPNGPAPCP